MATIDISSVVSYYNTSTRSKSGNGSGSGASRALAADAAQSNAESLAYGIDGGTPASGGSSSTTDLKFGSNYSSVSASIGTPVVTGSGTKWSATCSYSANRTSTMYQLKLKFTIPNGLTAANIESATISFTAKAGDTNEQTYYLCAPKTTSEQTTYQKYSETTIIDTSKFISFKAPGNTNVKTYTSNDFTNDFTDVFKQCITNGQGWVTILLPRDTPEATRTMTLSGTPQITYTENYSACGAPTSVSCGTAIQKPGATVSISWSGATAGTNNAIVGYRVYWKSGGAPTISSYTNYADVTSSPYSFTVPNDRGTTYYFKVLTRGTVSGYNSGLSSAQATTKVNSLPAVPSVTVNKARIKSTGEAVTFTVTAGSDSDSGQTLSVWYNTDGTSWSGSNCKQVPSNGQLTTGTLTATITYYFRTWDGLEYSSSYTSQSIIKNTPPTISSITMSAYNNTTYSPSKDNRSYVKNINGSASGVTGTSLSYQWYLCVGSGTDATSFETVTNISTATSLSNIDVTSYGANFNTAYKLALTVTDDLGESATAWSPDSNIYVIPPAPTISYVYNQKSDSNVSTANASHFGRYIRIYYSENNTGLTRKLQYKLHSNSAWTDFSSISGTEYSDIDLNSLTRNSQYDFRVVFTCNTKTTESSVVTRTRAIDMTPTNLTVTKQYPTKTYINPYTDTIFTISFGGQPNAFTNTNDTVEMSPNTTYPASTKTIYAATFKYGSNSAVNITNSEGSNRDGTVTIPMRLDDWKTDDWISCIKGSGTSAPNSSYNVTLTVTAKNSFEETFSATKSVILNFVEEVSSIGIPTLQIKTGSSSYTTIPSSYNNKTTSERYHIFEGQVLRLSLTGLSCYANQTATIYFMNGSTSLGSTKVSVNDWQTPSGYSHIYTLNGSKTINYTVPQNTVATDSSNVRNYSVKVVLDNGSSKLSTDSGQSNGNLNTCYHSRFAPSSINFSLSSVTESSWTWNCSDWGSIGSSSNKYGGDYSSVKAQFKTSNRADGGYSNLGSQQTLTPSNGSGTISQSLSSITYDVIYCGVTITLALNFQTIDSATPTGTATYTYTYSNLFAFYRATPNILYGKNFLCLNKNTPSNSDQLIEISTAQYSNNGTVTTRNKIYFGTDGTTFQITANGLEIDCGSW